MTKVDIFSGFLGAGKTTLIKKLIKEAFTGEKLVLIENEFGDIGIDGGFMQDAGIEVTEMNSGCICCSLVGDFGEALRQVLKEYNPDRILIEPSGVGKLSDVIKAVNGIVSTEIKLNSYTTIVDAKKCKAYMKNFGEFFNNQIEHASTIVLSHTVGLTDEKIDTCLYSLREHNSNATIITTDWDKLTGVQILAVMENEDTLVNDLHNLELETVCPDCGHHHHEEHCECEHEHHHHHDEHCGCGHHHHHHADDVFNSWGVETAKIFSCNEISKALKELEDSAKYGTILRAKGIVAGVDSWIHFDYVPSEPDVRCGSSAVIGRLCVIGAELNKDNLAKLFGVEVK